jgi:hypothetical protein
MIGPLPIRMELYAPSRISVNVPVLQAWSSGDGWLGLRLGDRVGYSDLAAMSPGNQPEFINGIVTDRELEIANGAVLLRVTLRRAMENV